MRAWKALAVLVGALGFSSPPALGIDIPKNAGYRASFSLHTEDELVTRYCLQRTVFRDGTLGYRVGLSVTHAWSGAVPPGLEVLDGTADHVQAFLLGPGITALPWDVQRADPGPEAVSRLAAHGLATRPLDVTHLEGTPRHPSFDQGRVVIDREGLPPGEYLLFLTLDPAVLAASPVPVTGRLLAWKELRIPATLDPREQGCLGFLELEELLEEGAAWPELRQATRRLLDLDEATSFTLRTERVAWLDGQAAQALGDAAGIRRAAEWAASLCERHRFCKPPGTEAAWWWSNSQRWREGHRSSSRRDSRPRVAAGTDAHSRGSPLRQGWPGNRPQPDFSGPGLRSRAPTARVNRHRPRQRRPRATPP